MLWMIMEAFLMCFLADGSTEKAGYGQLFFLLQYILNKHSFFDFDINCKLFRLKHMLFSGWKL